jgi:hypothetical protein
VIKKIASGRMSTGIVPMIVLTAGAPMCRPAEVEKAEL